MDFFSRSLRPKSHLWHAALLAIELTFAAQFLRPNCSLQLLPAHQFIKWPTWDQFLIDLGKLEVSNFWQIWWAEFSEPSEVGAWSSEPLKAVQVLYPWQIEQNWCMMNCKSGKWCRIFARWQNRSTVADKKCRLFGTRQDYRAQNLIVGRSPQPLGPKTVV